MKRLLALWVCSLGLAWAATLHLHAAASNPLARIQFLGHDWYDLSAWAKANRLTLTWNRATKLVHVTNRTTRLGFAVDSQQSVINGVKVWLSVPVTAQGGRVLIAVIDVQTVIQPLLKPVRPSPARRIKTIMLDPGHGGKDPGNLGGREQEKRYTLLLAQQVRSKLQAAGYHVLLTRNRDTYVGLPDRAVLANRAKADLLVSLHFNSVARNGAKVSGLEVFCLTPNTAASTHAPPQVTRKQSLPGHRSAAQSVLLAYQIQKAMVRRLGMVDRGVKHARFVVLRDTTMPAVLVEGGFMTAPGDLKKIADATFRAKMADAIVEGIRLYKQQVGG